MKESITFKNPLSDTQVSIILSFGKKNDHISSPKETMTAELDWYCDNLVQA